MKKKNKKLVNSGKVVVWFLFWFGGSFFVSFFSGREVRKLKNFR